MIPPDATFRKLLATLKVDGATGPDSLAAILLKELAEALAKPVGRLLQSILEVGIWPQCWRLHWLIPIHKKKSVWDAFNYRGVHLTTQASKVMERALLDMCAPYLREVDAGGPNHFAYTPGRGSRDALALMVLT